MTSDDPLVVEDEALLPDDEPASLTAARQLAEDSRLLRRGLPERQPLPQPGRRAGRR